MTPIELRARRVRLGLSQADLAVLLAVKQVTISRWESGASPVPIGIGLVFEGIEDIYDDLADEMTAAAEAEGGAIRATAAIENGAIVTVEGVDLPIPAGMVLSAAALVRWTLLDEAEEHGLTPPHVWIE